MFSPAVYDLPAALYLSWYSWLSLGPRYRGISSASPASAAWSSVNGTVCYPFVLRAPYDVQRFWWLNGATVGTDSFEAGVYTVDDDNVFDLAVQSPRTLSAGTVNQLQYATCAVGVSVVTSGTSTTDGTSFVTASVALKARPGVMYALVIANSKASAADVATTVETTGGALAFTSRNSQTYGAATEGRVNLWTAKPTSNVTDTVTITFGSTQTGCAWALLACTNVDTTTDHGIVQTAVGSGNSTTPLATLSALGSANNAVLGANANLADTTTTPGTGFAELVDINYATPTNCLQVQVGQNDTTSDGTITSGQWGTLAAEIKSLGTTRQLAPGRYVLGLWGSGNTATVFRANAAGLRSVGGYLNSTTSAGLPYTMTPTSSGLFLPLFGITSRTSP